MSRASFVQAKLRACVRGRGDYNSTIGWREPRHQSSRKDRMGGKLSVSPGKSFDISKWQVRGCASREVVPGLVELEWRSPA